MSMSLGQQESDEVATKLAVIAATLSANATQLSEHIERTEKRTHIKDIVIPALSLLVALTGVLATLILQISAQRSASELKQYEVTFIAKQKAYADLMGSIHELYAASAVGTKLAPIALESKVISNIYTIQPFMLPQDQERIQEEVFALINVCTNTREAQSRDDSEGVPVPEFLTHLHKVRDVLMKSLFPDPHQ
jgi:hypothetical protein